MADESGDKSAGQSGAWHVDRKIPLALVFTVALQFTGFVWWVSDQSAKQTQANDRITRLEADAAVRNAALQQIQVVLGRLDERMAFVVERTAPGRQFTDRK